MSDNTPPRQTFDEVALLYNEARPKYPDNLFTTLVNTVGLDPHATLLEIGPGTGQATKPLAERGFHITAVELGNSLAEVAKHELREYENVQILNVAFEDATLASKSFDLVYAATSFHWIDPSVKYSKTHDVLKDKGYLAIIQTNHISDQQGDKFFIDSQPIYDRYHYTDRHQKPKLPKNEELKPSEIAEHLFKLIHFQLFPMVITYTARDFVKLVNTFSNHLAAAREIQKAFYQEIENLISEQFNGKIDKHYSMSLTVARKIN
jgi:SAM-dependent methyltransferase